MKLANYRKTRTWLIFQVILVSFTTLTVTPTLSDQELAQQFDKEVRPFVENYCLNCHDNDEPKADLNLSVYNSVDNVIRDHLHWELVLERLKNGDMPPKKSRKQPSAEARKAMIEWIEAVRKSEAEKHAGDPGPVPARRLSNAEYDYTVGDLTGVDIRPTRAFPVDPANQAGFDNSAESLAMSPALVTKYLQAAREVADHLVLKPEGFEFAPHPAIADTDRDKWAVLRIVDFYRRQPTDYADYFLAAWRYKYRTALQNSATSLEQIAAEAKVSPKYLAVIWTTLTASPGEVGPIAKLQRMWNELPAPREASIDEVRAECLEMRSFVTRIRDQIVPEVKNLEGRPIHSGSQTLVMWKNRQMAANRRRFDPEALIPESAFIERTELQLAEAKKTDAPSTNQNSQSRTNRYGNRRRQQGETPDIVKKGGFSLAPTLLTTNSSATAKLATRRKGADRDLVVPDDPAARALFEKAFARFAEVFPDAFYISERARVYLDAAKEQENAGRLLSAGLHSMTGYFRDDQPLYDLILDEAGRRELDRLWSEFEFASSVAERMHTSFVWFERTDSGYMRDPEFDPFRPEDKSVIEQEKIRKLGEIYVAKAIRNDASETVQRAVQEHFAIVATNIARVQAQRISAVASHLSSLERFAERAYRRPLKDSERQDLHQFYQASRTVNGVDHEDAMRDCVSRVLMSPNFLFRMDLVEAGGTRSAASANGKTAVRALSNHALASRLSYFLWATMPDEELLARAAAGDLHKPDVLQSQVRRMLRDPRIRNFATEFAGNWLDIRRFEQHNSVDRARYPAFNDELRKAMFEEPIHFFVDVAQADRPILDFLYSKETFVNEPLARHYGIPFAGDSKEWIRVENAREFGRGGLFPMSVFLTANSPGLRTSPVKRGYWVVRRILGERIPPPPAVVPELPSDEKDLGKLTLRQALAEHRNNEACAGCHARFDSFGLVFESYGPVGERRERDFGGRPVDTRAEFPNTTEGEGLEGLIEYVRGNRENDFVENLCRKLLAYGLGRTLILSDEPLVTEMKSRLSASGYRFSTLIDAIVTSEQFLNKREGQDLARN